MVGKILKLFILLFLLSSANTFALQEGQFPLDGMIITLGKTNFDELSSWMDQHKVKLRNTSGNSYKASVGEPSSPYEGIEVKVGFYNGSVVITSINVKYKNQNKAAQDALKIKESLRRPLQTDYTTFSTQNYDLDFPARDPFESDFRHFFLKSNSNVQLSLNSLIEQYEYIRLDPSKFGLKLGNLIVGESKSFEIEELLSKCNYEIPRNFNFNLNTANKFKRCVFTKYDHDDRLVYLYKGNVFGFPNEIKGYMTVIPKFIDKVSNVYIVISDKQASHFESITKKLKAKYPLNFQAENYALFDSYRMYYGKYEKNTFLGSFTSSITVQLKNFETTIHFNAWDEPESSHLVRAKKFQKEMDKEKQLDKLL